MGCLRRLIMLGLLAGAVVAGWLLRDRWLEPPVQTGADTAAPAPDDGVWEPLTPEGAARARAAIARLREPAGPVFVNVRPGDLAAFLVEALRRRLPPSLEEVQAAVIRDRMYLRGAVRLSELGGEEVLGPLAGFLTSEKDTIQFGGTFEVLRPRLAQFRVQEIRIREFPIPARVLPRLVQRIRRGTIPEGVTADGLPLEVPAWLADVRIGRGQITLYKTAP